MDCEAFDKIVIDRVFQELDDLTTGAAQRHVAHCSRCRNIEAGLRATREVAALPSLDVPSDFADAVVSLERRARADLPLRHSTHQKMTVSDLLKALGRKKRSSVGMSEKENSKAAE